MILRIGRTADRDLAALQSQHVAKAAVQHDALDRRQCDAAALDCSFVLVAAELGRLTAFRHSLPFTKSEALLPTCGYYSRKQMVAHTQRARERESGEGCV